MYMQPMYRYCWSNSS